MRCKLWAQNVVHSREEAIFCDIGGRASTASYIIRMTSRSSPAAAPFILVSNFATTIVIETTIVPRLFNRGSRYSRNSWWKDSFAWNFSRSFVWSLAKVWKVCYRSVRPRLHHIGRRRLGLVTASLAAAEPEEPSLISCVCLLTSFAQAWGEAKSHCVGLLMQNKSEVESFLSTVQSVLFSLFSKTFSNISALLSVASMEAPRCARRCVQKIHVIAL